MKLNKEQTQKLFLGVILLGGLIYAFFEFLMRPLEMDRDAAKKSADAYYPRIMEARAQIAKAKGIEQEAPKAQELLSQVRQMIPEGSPVAWFPPRIVDFFKEREIDRVTCRMSTESVDKELNGFRRLSWGIEVPAADFMPFAAALAELENREPLLEVQSITIEAGRDKVANQRVVINVNNIVRL